MAEIKLTKQQSVAVESTGGQLLVSAAAGSGKTKVIVERLMHKIDQGFHIDNFLLITYTNAAAAELRAKILDTLYERIAVKPENRRLRREIDLCGRAHIGTIHSFCAGVIRENAGVLGIAPDFRICDESESRILKDETLRELLDEMYDVADPGFVKLADTMGAGRNDNALVNIVLDTHEKILSHPDPAGWVQQQISMLKALDPAADASDTIWGRQICDRARSLAAYWRSQMEGLVSEIKELPDLEKAYGQSIDVTCACLQRFCDALGESWDSARECSKIEFPRAKSISGYDDIKAIRNRCKKAVEKLPDMFHDESEKVLRDLIETAPIVEALFNLVLRFDREYADRKKRRGLLDFSDQEHIALKLLVDLNTGMPTETAKQISDRFAEIMIDEYQDVNEIQEIIFSSVSRNMENIFMVGDVKQSIYRFRLADPTIFLNKYRSFKDVEEAEKGEGRRVILSKNFRSRKEILDSVNFVFRNVMSREFGELDYTKREYLYAGAEYLECEEEPVEVDLLDLSASEEWNDLNRSQAEARFVSNRIKELIASFRVSDGASGTRPAEYGDIAVLMRSPRSHMREWIEQFAKDGIPVNVDADTSFFDEPEVTIIISLLTIIDNPRQDIPLISVMRSPVYGFTPDDLAKIRICDRQGDFYSALVKSAEENEKSREFLNQLNRFRNTAPDMPADRFIWFVYRQTNLLAIAGAMPEGKKRRDNLMTLFQLASRLESNGYKGLFGFITYIREMMARGESPTEGAPASSANAVTIMSIHKSKGLEFPIVILADLAKRFNTDDSNKPLLLHPELGIGPKHIDAIRRLAYPTIARTAIRYRLISESMSEELRVLYVAMTRAKEKLIMLVTYKNAQREISRLSGIPIPAPPQFLEETHSAADWLLITALHRPESEPIRFGLPMVPCNDGSVWKIHLIKGPEEPTERRNSCAPLDRENSSGERTEYSIADKLNYKYPYLDAAHLPSKVTATELKGTYRFQEAAEEAQPISGLGDRTLPPGRPDFMEGVRGLTAAQIGTATHIVMQFINFDKCMTIGGVQEEIERLRLLRTITDEQAEAVSPQIITSFFNSDLGQIIMDADKLWREFKFSLLVDSGEIPGFSAGEKLLMQGVVDCCIEKNGKLTILDFKTDFVTHETAREKANGYRGQLEAYALAMERILDEPVKKKVICFLTAGINVEL